MKFFKHTEYIGDVTRRGQLPRLKPGEILVTAEDNRLVDDETIMPYINQFAKDDWITKTDTDGGYKYCPGGQDMMHAGITIPLWADLRVRPSMDMQEFQAQFNVINEKPGTWHMGEMGAFEKKQTGECPFTERRVDVVKNGQYLKLVNPFNFMTPRGYSSIITGSLMNPRPEFDIIPGIVNTDYYHTLNVIMNVLTDKEFYISQGTPIAQVTFFKRSDNVSKMYVGGDSVFRTISTRGFGGPLAPLEDWRRGKYRREQRKWD